MADLSGLTALITGAGGGIGAAMAETFAAAGARLALVDIVDCGGLAARLGEGHRSDLLDLLTPRPSRGPSRRSAGTAASTS